MTATRSPAAANARAIASPIPRLPPVTSTDRRHAQTPHLQWLITVVDGSASRRYRRHPGCVRTPPDRVGHRDASDPGDSVRWARGPRARRPARPGASAAAVVLDVATAGVNYADTHQAEDNYLAPAEAAVRPGRRGRRARPRTGGASVALVGTGGYAEQALAHRGDHLRAARRRRRHGRARAGRPGPHRVAPAAHQRPPGARRVGRRARSRGRGRHARRPARQAAAAPVRVIATASTPEKRDLALDLGADVAIDPADVDDLRDALRSRRTGASRSTSCWR